MRLEKAGGGYGKAKFRAAGRAAIAARPIISLEERRAKGEAAREVAKEGPT